MSTTATLIIIAAGWILILVAIVYCMSRGYRDGETAQRLVALRDPVTVRPEDWRDLLAYSEDDDR